MDENQNYEIQTVLAVLGGAGLLYDVVIPDEVPNDGLRVVFQTKRRTTFNVGKINISNLLKQVKILSILLIIFRYRNETTRNSTIYRDLHKP